MASIEFASYNINVFLEFTSFSLRDRYLFVTYLVWYFGKDLFWLTKVAFEIGNMAGVLLGTLPAMIIAGCLRRGDM